MTQPKTDHELVNRLTCAECGKEVPECLIPACSWLDGVNREIVEALCLQCYRKGPKADAEQAHLEGQD